MSCGTSEARPNTWVPRHPVVQDRRRGMSMACNGMGCGTTAPKLRPSEICSTRYPSAQVSKCYAPEHDNMHFNTATGKGITPLQGAHMSRCSGAVLETDHGKHAHTHTHTTNEANHPDKGSAYLLPACVLTSIRFRMQQRECTRR